MPRTIARAAAVLTLAPRRRSPSPSDARLTRRAGAPSRGSTSASATAPRTLTSSSSESRRPPGSATRSAPIRSTASRRSVSPTRPLSVRRSISSSRALGLAPDVARAAARSSRAALERAPDSARLLRFAERFAREHADRRALVDALLALADRATRGKINLAPGEDPLREAVDVALALEDRSLAERILRKVLDDDPRSRPGGAGPDGVRAWAMIALAHLAEEAGNLAEAVALARTGSAPSSILKRSDSSCSASPSPQRGRSPISIARRASTKRSAFAREPTASSGFRSRTCTGAAATPSVSPRSSKRRARWSTTPRSALRWASSAHQAPRRAR